MSKKMLRLFLDHPCILHIPMQENIEEFIGLPYLEKDKSGGLYFTLGASYKNTTAFNECAFSVLNKAISCNKFRNTIHDRFGDTIELGDLVYDIYDAINHDNSIRGI